MRAFLLCCCLLLGAISRADESLEFVGGSFTYHLIDGSSSSDVYTQKVTANGLGIFNPLFGVRYTNEEGRDYWTATAFYGSNSLGFPMEGGLVSTGIKPYSWMYMGWVFGGYFQDDAPFTRVGLTAPALFKVGNTDFIPVPGGEINFKWMMTKHLFIKENNIISFLYNATLSIGYEF